MEKEQFEEILKTNLDKFRGEVNGQFKEMKSDISGMKSEISDIKKTTNETLDYVKTLDKDASSDSRKIKNLQERVHNLDGLKYNEPEMA